MSITPTDQGPATATDVTDDAAIVPVGADDGASRSTRLASALRFGLLGLVLLLCVGVAIGLDRGRHAPAAAPPATDPSTTLPAADPSCLIAEQLDQSSTGDDVRCLEAVLSRLGYFDGTPDGTFDAATLSAVESFQSIANLPVDGIVGSRTSSRLGTWIGPTGRSPDPSTCPSDGHAAVIDRFNQRAWLCDDGSITKVMPMTSASNQPNPGTYKVYEKDMNASSNLTGRRSTMTHFVAFTKGIYQGARVAFHSIPKYGDGSYVQPLSSVGAAELYGDSSGCIRVLPDDAQLIWDWLAVGDTVTVVS